MKISAFIMGICPPDRLNWLNQSVGYLDSQNFPFVKKFLVIAEFGGYTFPKEIHNFYECNGWTILLDNYKSRSRSTERVLKEIDTEYLFYNEDDVLATMPNYDDVIKVFQTDVKERHCGMISMTLGGSKFDPTISEIGDLKYMEDNTILLNDKYRIFTRMEELRNDWFFEFPGLFIKSDLFRKVQDHANVNCRGMSMEMGLTKSWFDLQIYEEYYKSSIALPNSLSVLLKDQLQVNNSCRLLCNLDINQGNSVYGNVGQVF